MSRRKFFTCCLLIIIFLPSFSQAIFFKNPAKQEVVKENKERNNEIQAGPKDIKEETSIYFFLGWMWLSIGVIVYFIRLKIKELDRLTKYGFQLPENEIDKNEKKCR